MRPVILISNDVVPGSGMPVAAPGLRVFGLREGLAAHGYETTVVSMRGPVDDRWAGGVPTPTQDGVVILGPGEMAGFIEANAPASVIITNGNQVDHLRPIAGISYVLDFFAPKLLELAYSGEGGYPTESLAALRARKVRAIELADAFIVNGHKKEPYFIAWLLQADRDTRRLPLSVVEMCVPARFRDRPDRQSVEMVMAGYLQGWSKPGPWLPEIAEWVSPDTVHLNLLMPVHWGQHEDIESSELSSVLDNPGVVSHGAKTFADFQDFMSSMDVAVDLFSRNREREYAMVTRSIVALACGVPVVHPPFTEVSPMIEEYDAGWIVSPTDLEQIRSVMQEITADRDMVAQKQQNARLLWRRRLDPSVAVEPLVDILQKLDENTA